MMLAELQTLAAPTLQKLGIGALKTLTDTQVKTAMADATKTTANVTLTAFAAIADAQLTPLGLSQAALTGLDITKLVLSELKDLDVALLTKIGFKDLKTLDAAKLRALPETTAAQRTDKQAIAGAVGISRLADIQPAHLEALTLPILATLTNAALTPFGLSQAALTGVNTAKLTGLTLQAYQSLPQTALAKIGIDILATLGAILPLKPSDMTGQSTLAGGLDGQRPTPILYAGLDANGEKSGLRTFTDIEEISIVAAPGSSYCAGSDTTIAHGIALEVITHCELMRYRIGVLDMPNNRILSEARDYRSNFDSKYAAMYYPWVKVSDPLDTTGRREILVPPSGYVTGIYARNDAERSVSKAPANEVLRGALSLEYLLNKSQQDILNPDGIDCFHFFPGRGVRLWGARTISSDSEWKYVNVRRYFAYLEHSIDKGSQFAVFENNNSRLWNNVRTAIEDFLFSEWRNGNLMGDRPTDAFFVRCDRSTMTQNDIDNGRLVCLIGVAVNKPAEFVIFRIGQMTADSKS